MKMKRLILLGLLVGSAALAVSSCAYDPYYSSSSYSSGFGYGRGYGSTNFSTSVFVSTGNPRWGYDPYAGCYYDYTRRSYYDPHLYGYYPVGYRPRYVYGAPHPYGWSRGSGYCPPPKRIRRHMIENCDNRAESYRSLGRDWSDDVRVSAPIGDRPHRQEGSRQDGWRGEGNHPAQENPQSPSMPFFNGDGNGRDPSGRGDASGGDFDRGDRQQPTMPDPGFQQNDSPPPSAPAFEEPPQIEAPAFEAPPQIEAPAPPPEPQAPVENSEGIRSLGEG